MTIPATTPAVKSCRVGVTLAHETVRQCGTKFAQLFAVVFRALGGLGLDDEAENTINGRWIDLGEYRADAADSDHVLNVTVRGFFGYLCFLRWVRIHTELHIKYATAPVITTTATTDR